MGTKQITECKLRGSLQATSTSTGRTLASSLSTSAEPLLFLGVPVPHVCPLPCISASRHNSSCPFSRSELPPCSSLTSHPQESGHVGIDFFSSQTPSWFTSLTSFTQVSLISVIYVLIHFPNYTQGRRLRGDNYRTAKKNVVMLGACISQY